MNISKEDVKKFEHQYLIKVIKVPSYRYGQAFINYFWSDEFATYIRSLPPIVEDTLWSTASKKEAEEIINKNFTII